MADEKQLEKQVNEYAEIAKENPNVDASMLMMSALRNQRQNTVSSKAKKWAYLISIGVPFAGFLWALAYYTRDEDDAKQVAITCAVLSVVCLVMTWAFGKLLINGSGTSVDQIQLIKTDDILQLTR